MKNIIQLHVKAMLLGVGLLFLTLSAMAQTQKGADIDGEAAYDESGYSVSMPDANTVAIGAPYSAGSAPGAGHVRIFTWNGTSWVQKGGDIDGEASLNRAGSSVSMPDANTIAIGAPWNSANGMHSGHVRVFKWNGIDWVQRGNDIDGDSEYDYSGSTVSMPDSNTVAIGSPNNGSIRAYAGRVRIFAWNGTAWIKKGIDIDGESASDESGYSVSMPDANTVAIGAPHNDKGHVRVFGWSGTAWVQRGGNIEGESDFDKFGYSVSMSDANTVAIGGPQNAGNGTNAGHVRVYRWNGSIWIQKGMDLDGEAADDLSGSSVSMPDANTVAIGAPGNAGNGTNAGNVRVYGWNGSAWIQKGLDIDGEEAFDKSGYSLSMVDATTLAIGAPYSSGKGLIFGHVRVYTVTNAVFVENSFGLAFRAYPNPTPGELNIDLGAVYPAVEVIARNALGQVVMQQSFSNIKTLQLNIPGEAGLYMLEINSNDKKALLKVMKK